LIHLIAFYFIDRKKEYKISKILKVHFGPFKTTLECHKYTFLDELPQGYKYLSLFFKILKKLVNFV
jgi:hypothetical protein